MSGRSGSTRSSTRRCSVGWRWPEDGSRRPPSTFARWLALAERAADIQFVAPGSVDLAQLALWQGRPGEAAGALAEAIGKIGFLSDIKVLELYAVAVRAYADAAELARARRSSAEARAAVAAGESILAALQARHAEIVAD